MFLNSKMINGKLLTFSVCLLLILLNEVKTQNYCADGLCKNGNKHIACNNDGSLSSNCGSNTQVITITDARRQSILEGHNTRRNQIAGGSLTNYKSARRMATMQWSAELAKLAVLNVKQCAMKHDACRNTNDFPIAGQNIAVTNWSGVTRTIEQIIDQHLRLWWDEYKQCSMTYINSYKAPPSSSKAFGHFTQMAQERATHVGCGVLRTQRGNFTYQYMACNYAMTNIVNRAVYRSGETGNLCKTGKNTIYNNLCSIKEVYNVKSGNYE